MAFICFISFPAGLFSTLHSFLLILPKCPNRHPHRWVLFFLYALSKKQPSPYSEYFPSVKAHLSETSSSWAPHVWKGHRCLESTCEDGYTEWATLLSGTGTGETSGVGVGGGLRGECCLKQLTHSSVWTGWLSGWLLWCLPPNLRPQHAWLLWAITGCSATLTAPHPNNSQFHKVIPSLFPLFDYKKRFIWYEVDTRFSSTSKFSFYLTSLCFSSPQYRWYYSW